MNRQESLDFIQARETLTEAGVNRDVAEAVIRTVRGVVVETSATRFDLERTGNRLDLRITEETAKLERRITELDGKIDTKVAEVRTDIQDGVRRITRNIVIIVSLVLALMTLFEALRPVLRTVVEQMFG